MNILGSKLFDIPKGYDAWVAIVLTLFFLLFFLFAYGGASFISGLIPWRFELPFTFEQSIPFIPATSLVYLSMIVMLMLSPFILRRSVEIIPLFCILVVETTICAVFFILFPVETIFPERVAKGVVGSIFDFADFLNMERNYFPSLHVCFAFTAALCYLDKTQIPGRLIFFIWALAISISTLLIHEHYIIDVLAGIVLSLLCWKIVGRWVKKDDILIPLNIELFCLYNFIKFGQHHPRYWLITLEIYKQSIPSFRHHRILRTGVCFLQLIDDIINGDQECHGEPIDYVNTLIIAIKNNEFDNTAMMQLAYVFREALYAKGGNSLQDALAHIQNMLHDRKSVLSGMILNGEPLNPYLSLLTPLYKQD